MTARSKKSRKVPEERGGLWQLARERGVSRRRFLQLLSAGGTAAVLAACTGLPLPTGTLPLADENTAEAPPFSKDPAPFIELGGGNLEARLENMQGLITPSRYFFVRNNSVSLEVDAADWRLTVEGDAVASRLELSYDDILNLPSQTYISYLECSGNQRAMFDLVKGQAAKGTQWKTGAVGNGVWTGATMRDVLERAGITEEAVSVLLIGLDTGSPEEGFRRVMPVEKAMDSDTLLAYALNGEVLPRDHGFPLRALAPGWVGAASVKWLGRIVVSSNQLWTRNNTTSYTLIGDAYPPVGESAGKAIDNADGQERAGAAVAGRFGGGGTQHLWLRALVERADRESGVEQRFRGDVERFHAGGAADSTGIRASCGGSQRQCIQIFMDAFRLYMGCGAG